MQDNLAFEMQNKTIRKVFDERAEFIIIGLTGSVYSGMPFITEILTKNFDELNMSERYSEEPMKQLEYNIIYSYAREHWKPFDVIKARDIIITYILENKKSIKRFYNDISKVIFKDTSFVQEVQNGINKIYREVGQLEDEKKEDILKLLDGFLSLIREKGLEEALYKKNHDLIEYIDVLKNKDASIWGTRPNLQLYVYTKYILPVIGNVLKKSMQEEKYTVLFQQYGNEIRFFGTLDISQWKGRLDEIGNVEKIDYFYSIAKRINTFIKIRRAPMSNQKSVPVRIVIDSLKNPYEFSFLKDRYSAYYTFAMLSKDEQTFDEERFSKNNYEKNLEVPNLIKNSFKSFVKRLFEKAQKNGMLDPQEYKYIESMIDPEKFLQYLYEKLDEATEKNASDELCPDLIDVEYEDDYIEDGINKDEFMFYKRLIKDPVRVFCMISGLFPFYLQDIQSATQSSDIFLSSSNKKDLTYQIVRYVSLMMHPGLVTPTEVERCMQVAFSAKVNSGCISRQVGAVVTDKNYNILSLGWNDVHCEKVPCIYRNICDLQKAPDENVYSDLEMRERGSFRTHMKSYDFSDQKKVNSILDGLPSAYCFKTVYNGLMHGNNPEYSRAIHGEARAFWSCNKEAAKDGCLFTTSSSCENCTILANEHGIKKIYYIEKYAGISQEHVNASGPKKNRAEFILFEGAIGNAYMKLYTPVLPLKDELELRGIKYLMKKRGRV